MGRDMANTAGYTVFSILLKIRVHGLSIHFRNGGMWSFPRITGYYQMICLDMVKMYSRVCSPRSVKDIQNGFRGCADSHIAEGYLGYVFDFDTICNTGS